MPTISAPPQTRALRPLSALPGPKGLPLLGNLLDIKPTRLHLIFEDWCRRHGDLYVVHMARKPILIVGDAELAQKILKDRPKGYGRWRSIEEVMIEMGVDGVFTAEGDDWIRHRRLVMSAFARHNLRQNHDKIVEITRRLRNKWLREAAGHKVIDAVRDLSRYTIDITTMIAFGQDMNVIERDQHPLLGHLGAIFAAVNRRINTPLPYWRVFKLPSDRALDRSLAEVNKVLLELIQTARARMESDPSAASSPRNLLEAMLVARDGDHPKGRLSDAEVTGNVLTLLLGGEDTTSNTIAWMLYFMARHPEVQARMQAEADSLLVDSDLPESPEAAQKLSYIGAVAEETLRCSSAAPLLFAESRSDLALGDVAVPKGTSIILLLRFIGLKKDHYHEPALFLPERWLDSASEAPGKRDPRATLAFGSGPRVCPGKSLAMLEFSMFGAMVARNFEVSLADPSAPVDELFDFTMRPRGLFIRLSPRWRGTERGLVS
jgi:cytochrome P450